MSSTAGIGDPAGLNEWLEKRLGGRSARLQVEAAPADPGQLPQLIRQLDCGLVAVPAGIVQAGADAVRELAESVACDVLIVR